MHLNPCVGVVASKVIKVVCVSDVQNLLFYEHCVTMPHKNKHAYISFAVIIVVKYPNLLEYVC